MSTTEVRTGKTEQCEFCGETLYVTVDKRTDTTYAVDDKDRIHLGDGSCSDISPMRIEALASRAGFLTDGPDGPDTGEGIETNFLVFDVKYPNNHQPYALANFSEAAGVTEGLEGGRMLGMEQAEEYAKAFQILLNDATPTTLAKFAKFISG